MDLTLSLKSYGGISTPIRYVRHGAAVLIPFAHSHCFVQRLSWSLSISFTKLSFTWLKPLVWFAKSSLGSFHLLFSGARFPIFS